MKAKIALFFSVLFLTLIILPTVITLTDNNQEISILLDFGEEEENKGKESSESKVDSEVKIHSSSNSKSLFKNNFSTTKSVVFHLKNYISEYPKITTPPPKKLLSPICFSINYQSILI